MTSAICPIPTVSAARRVAASSPKSLSVQSFVSFALAIPPTSHASGRDIVDRPARIFFAFKKSTGFNPLLFAVLLSAGAMTIMAANRLRFVVIRN